MSSMKIIKFVCTFVWIKQLQYIDKRLEYGNGYIVEMDPYGKIVPKSYN